MSMFLGQFDGPESEDSFAQAFVELVQPTFGAQAITLSALVGDDERYYIQGLSNLELPIGRLIEAAEGIGWKANIRSFRNAMNLPNPGARIRKCDMPFNAHDMGNEPHLSCPGGHDISIVHNVAYCPACGQPLH